MFKITEKQIAILDSDFRARFREELQGSIFSENPLLAQRLSGPKMEMFAEAAVSKAYAHGLRSKRHVFRIARTMLHLGIDFDEDPMVANVGAALVGGGHPETRTQTMVQRASFYMKEVLGEKKEHLLEAVGRLQGMLDAPPIEPRSSTEIHALLRALYPRKIDRLHWPTLYQHGLRRLAERELSEMNELVCFFVFWLFLGVGFKRDPLYPFCNGDAGSLGERQRAASEFIARQLELRGRGPCVA